MIARRWFVTNAFDGNLSILGLLLGSRAVRDGAPEASLLLAAGLGICGALAISQSAGNILTERAERVRHLKELEDSMLRSLNDTIHEDAAVAAPLIAGFIGGTLPAAYTTLTLIPYMLGYLGLIGSEQAFWFSVGGVLLSVFFLGVLLGTISRTSLLLAGLKMVAVGALTAALLFLVGVL